MAPIVESISSLMCWHKYSKQCLHVSFISMTVKTSSQDKSLILCFDIVELHTQTRAKSRSKLRIVNILLFLAQTFSLQLLYVSRLYSVARVSVSVIFTFYARNLLENSTRKWHWHKMSIVVLTHFKGVFLSV